MAMGANLKVLFHLDAYLDEFEWRFNNRTNPFQIILRASSHHRAATNVNPIAAAHGTNSDIATPSPRRKTGLIPIFKPAIFRQERELHLANWSVALFLNREIDRIIRLLKLLFPIAKYMRT